MQQPLGNYFSPRIYLSNVRLMEKLFGKKATENVTYERSSRSRLGKSALSLFGKNARLQNDTDDGLS